MIRVMSRAEHAVAAFDVPREASSISWNLTGGTHFVLFRVMLDGSSPMGPSPAQDPSLAISSGDGSSLCVQGRIPLVDTTWMGAREDGR